ncbi:MAG TPA: CvpA family protein [Rhizobacter sp.]|nr:CvpA family protein [Rhizobacter sp.]
MSWVDGVLLGVLVLSMLVGAMRGLAFEIMSLLGWFAAYFAAQWLAPMAAPHIPLGQPGSPMNWGAAFTAVFMAALLVWAVASGVLRLLIQASPLSPVDRLLGAAFGLVRGTVLLLAAATLINLTPLAKTNSWHACVGAHWLNSALTGLRPVLAPQLSERLPA